MEQTVEKTSETEVQVSTTTKNVIDISELSQSLETSKRSLADFEAWVIEERACRQAIVDDAEALIGKARDVGVVVAVETIEEPIEVIPSDEILP